MPSTPKLFVGGIASQTREDALLEHFGKYGDVKDVVVIRDRYSGNGRGFGFVEFADVKAAEAALGVAEKHVIHGRTVDVKPAMPRGNQNQYKSQCQFGEHCRACGESEKKLFVGGLPETITPDEFRSYFERFGTVTDSVILYEKETNKPRGFGFVTFDTKTAVHNVMQNKHQLNGKFVDVNLAMPRDRNNCRKSNNGRDNNYGAGVGFRGEPAFYGYQGQFYQPFASRHPYFHGQIPHTPYFYGGNSFVGYGYDSHYATPRASWNGHPSMSSSHGCFSYDDFILHPPYQTAASSSNMDIVTDYDTQGTQESINGLNTQITSADSVIQQHEGFSLPQTSAAHVRSLEDVVLQSEDGLSNNSSSQAGVETLGQPLPDAPSEVEAITLDMASLQVKSMSGNNNQ